MLTAYHLVLKSGTLVALSASGNILAVGAPLSDIGYVRVFQRDSTLGWLQIGIIFGEESGDRFGNSIDLSSNGHILAVGATLNDGSGTEVNTGHVRVFEVCNNVSKLFISSASFLNVNQMLATTHSVYFFFSISHTHSLSFFYFRYFKSLR